MTSSMFQKMFFIFLSMALFNGPTRGLAEEKPPLRIVYADSWHPISYSDNGRANGILPQKAQELLFHQLNIPLEHIAVPWGRAQMMMKNGQADAFITTATTERLKFSDPSSKSIFFVPFVLVTKSGSTIERNITTPDTLYKASGSFFCDVLGNGWAQAFYEDKNVAVHYAPRIQECLQMLVAGRVDGIVHAKAVIEHYIKERQYQDQLTIHQTPAQASPYFPILISKTSPWHDHLLEALDRYFERAPNLSTITID